MASRNSGNNATSRRRRSPTSRNVGSLAMVGTAPLVASTTLEGAQSVSSARQHRLLVRPEG
eukprot:4803968-Amphidinium_carterae.1